MKKLRLAAGTAAANAAASAAPPAIEPGGVRGMTTVPGQMAALLPGFVEAKDALAKAKAALAKWDDVIPVRKLNAKLIRRSKWANRSEAEFLTSDFAAFKEEIANAGGNIQPIQVRKVLFRTTPVASEVESSGVVLNNTLPDAYEIAYGHRRHQACLELDLPVLCQIVDEMDDRALFEVMDRENRSRKNLSAYDQGRMYVQAIESGLYPSLRKMAEALGVDLGNASKYIQLARLPDSVVKAFPSPFDLAQRWAKPLTDAVAKSSAAVEGRAKEAMERKGSMDASGVFELLIGKAASVTKVSAIEIKGKKVASVKTDKRGRTTVEFEAGSLSSAKQVGLTKLVREYLSQS